MHRCMHARMQTCIRPAATQPSASPGVCWILPGTFLGTFIDVARGSGWKEANVRATLANEDCRTADHVRVGLARWYCAVLGGWHSLWLVSVVVVLAACCWLLAASCWLGCLLPPPDNCGWRGARRQDRRRPRGGPDPSQTSPSRKEVDDGPLLECCPSVHDRLGPERVCLQRQVECQIVLSLSRSLALSLSHRCSPRRSAEKGAC